MIKRILVAYDASTAAELALNFANELAERFGAGLHILSVAQPPEFGDEVETEAVIERSRAHFHHAFKLLATAACRSRDGRPPTSRWAARPSRSCATPRSTTSTTSSSATAATRASSAGCWARWRAR